ncbi:conserved hypothetical protein [Treponema primitia ZAS-2]|uniref:Uncharacterized protein n=1 Tax=Treponema primitia (strain ATCC BAA-887 / DSM 12427 / ZAS-2) TaxID=545694 RepID=F5YLQ0_TREPZ|nr:glycosyltransferase family 1 protein [Treponema primitia]AEF83941.1 conserved hypothetical protein [Treponema primitia ZAS-2]
MRIALIHYHLRRGGVTSVILNQARALIEGGDDALIITGVLNPDAPDLNQVLVEELRYDREQPLPPPEGQEQWLKDRGVVLAAAITRAMQAHWGREADIIHVHNPLLRKNTALLPALALLQERYGGLLLQNHDLAEDFRPDVYVGKEEYPANCHYAVINSRDYSFLHRSGLKTEGLHLLPNEVHPIKATPGLERKRYLYPVRGIQRKNLGEALLLSLFIPKGKTVAITLPPTMEKDFQIYNAWVNFARELGLPVEFNAGQDSSLEDLYGSAEGVISCSVKEGFGFSFLEPWTAGRAVLGRRIDYVCKDFESSGVRFNSLYSALNIPMVYISPSILREKMEYAMSSVYKSFGIVPPRHTINMLGNDLLSRDLVDFSRLDEKTQEGIIRVLDANKSVFRDIADVNPFLGELESWRPDEDLIEANRLHILDSYGRQTILELLRETYRSVLDTQVTHKISKSILLELYLDPLRLSLVGVGHD